MKRNVAVTVIVVVVAILSFLIGRNTSVEQAQVPKGEAEKKVTVTFPGAEKHEVSLAEAKQYIQNYRKNLQSQKTKSPQIQGGAFEKGAIEKILAQPGCAQLRIYYGQKEDGNPNLVLVGVDTSGNDMTKGIFMEKVAPCPPWCDKTSELK
jgi:hypothetical protein